MKLPLTIDTQGWMSGVDIKKAADYREGGLSPLYIIIHYTAGASRDSDLKQLTAEDDVYVSSHFHISSDGIITQLVSTKDVAYHAGKSQWKTHQAMNPVSLGIELENWGLLTQKEGKISSWSGREIPKALVEPHSGRYWASYTDNQYWQLSRLISALIMLKAVPPCVQLLGHEHVSPGRKIDPGPAFDWRSLRTIFPNNCMELPVL